MQCQGDVITEDYLDFPKESCPNMSEPCWIPQVQDILPKNITSKLFLCDSVEKYTCMLFTAMSSRKNVKKQCKVSFIFGSGGPSVSVCHRRRRRVMTVTSRRGIWNNFWFRQPPPRNYRRKSLEEPRGERQCGRRGGVQVRHGLQ